MDRFASPLAVRPKQDSDGFHTIGDVMPLTASAHVVACATTLDVCGWVQEFTCGYCHSTATNAVFTMKCSRVIPGARNRRWNTLTTRYTRSDRKKANILSESSGIVSQRHFKRLSNAMYKVWPSMEGSPPGFWLFPITFLAKKVALLVTPVWRIWWTTCIAICI